MFVVWQISTSVSQPLFAYWGDRFGSRRLIFVGPATAIICISLMGATGDAALLTLLLAVGGLGVGAFHPEAAVNVVEAGGSRLSRALSIFICGGMLGLGLGPWIGGRLVESYGLASLIWILGPGLVLLTALCLLKGGQQQHALHQAPEKGLGDLLEGQWGRAGLLLAVSTLRGVPALGIPFVMAFWLDQQGVKEGGIGAMQSVFLLSGGIGTLVCPLLIRPGKEIGGLILTNVAGTVCMLLLNMQERWAIYAGLAGSGLLLQGGIPVLMAYSQKLLPQGRRLAASLILGTSWGIASLIVAGVQAYLWSVGHFDGFVTALIPFGLLAAATSWWLPDVTSPVGVEEVQVVTSES
jgi:FSR family fosmidomycin resistance protein-like MFS transporter